MSKLLREKQGGDEGSRTAKTDKNQRKSSDDIHGLPQLLASLDVEKRQAEETIVNSNIVTSCIAGLTFSSGETASGAFHFPGG